MRVPLSHRIPLEGPFADVTLRGLGEEEVPLLRLALRANREHLAPWEPAPPALGLVDVARSLARYRREWEEDRGYTLFALRGGVVVGKVALTQVVRGPLEGAYLGYWVTAPLVGRGLGTEMVRAATAFAFRGAGLHRVQAAVMPRNAPSQRLLTKLGYRQEGLALRYLRIAGVWEDHLLFAKTAEELTASPG